MLKKEKKAQLKIQQMAFMLMALTLFFVLIGLFFIVTKLSGLKESVTNLEKENAQKLIMKLASSPEFSCENAFRFGEIDCVDFDKVMVLRESISNYNKFWGVADIEITKIYPEKTGECTYMTYPHCKTLKIYSENVDKKPAVSNFVALCRKEEINEEVMEICEVGKINIMYEDKTKWKIKEKLTKWEQEKDNKFDLIQM